jgi:hypothetical protein
MAYVTERKLEIMISDMVLGFISTRCGSMAGRSMLLFTVRLLVRVGRGGDGELLDRLDRLQCAIFQRM